MPGKFLSDERIVDSSEDSGSDASQDEAEASSSSSSEVDASTSCSSSSSASVNGADSHKRKAKARVKNDVKRQKLTTSPSQPKDQGSTGNGIVEEDEESDSGESSSSGNGSSGSYATAEDNATASPEINGNALRRASESTAPPTPTPARNTAASWQPPRGFETAPEASQSSASLVGLFSTDSLAGKELWHITAPASVPITSLTEVTLGRISRGEATLSHEGAEYALIIDQTGKERTSLPLVPSEDYVSYKAAQTTFAQTLRLEKVAQPHSLQQPSQGDSQSTSGSTSLQAKPPRLQPEGLRTRFWPAGFEDKSYKDTTVRSVEEEELRTSSSEDSSDSDSASSKSDQDEDLESKVSIASEESTKQSEEQTSRESSQESSDSSSGSSESEGSSSSTGSSGGEESSDSDE